MLLHRSVFICVKVAKISNKQETSSSIYASCVIVEARYLEDSRSGVEYFKRTSKDRVILLVRILHTIPFEYGSTHETTVKYLAFRVSGDRFRCLAVVGQAQLALKGKSCRKRVTPF